MDTKQTILIVDDTKENIDIVLSFLDGYDVLVALSGKKALKHLQNNTIDLILLDIIMPEMDGYEVCKILKSKEETRNIPIIFITAQTDEESIDKAYDVGGIDYVTKPFKPKELLARINRELKLRSLINNLEIQVEKEVEKRQKTLEIQQRMESELNIGHDIQMSMIPSIYPAFSNFKNFCVYADIKPAREVGGDFYDLFFIDDSHLCLVIGDVSGKGVPAALFMAVARTLIKSRASNDISPASVLSYVNQEMSIDNPASMFVTLFIGVVDLDDGNLTYSNAGHNPPYIVKDNKQLECLDARHGPVVGAMEDLVYRQSSLTLEKNDTLFIFTDGVTEAMNNDNELYGESRLEKFLINHETNNVNLLVKSVMSDIEIYEKGHLQSDDITILAFNYIGDDSVAIEKISIENKLENIAYSIEKMRSFCNTNMLEKTIVSRMSIVVDDLLNNIINYGYQDTKEHTIYIKLKLSNTSFVVEILDDAIAFNPFAEKEADVTASLEDREIGGLGICLVKNILDAFSYQRKMDRNILILKMDVSLSKEES